MTVVQASAPENVNSPEQSARDVVSFLSLATRVLFINGETTRRMVLGLERLGRALGVNVTVMARWGEVVLRIDDPAGPRLHWIAAMPVGVDMQKVAAANDLIDRFCKNGIGFDDAQSELAAIRHLPPVSLARFVLLTAAGAAALGVIFGAGQWLTLCLIALSAGAGALLRRWFATLGNNPFAQPFGAALLAGVVGAIVARFQLVAMPHLVAVCPCMVLVPGISSTARSTSRARASHSGRAGSAMQVSPPLSSASDCWPAFHSAASIWRLRRRPGPSRSAMT
jgi:uncharacterized membrane protein YjjP (DUF1212 family)